MAGGASGPLQALQAPQKLQDGRGAGGGLLAAPELLLHVLVVEV